MANQIVVSSGAKVRDLNDVIIGTSGVLSSLAFNVSNGVPKLDVNGKILVSQLPNSVMEYLGTWNAATNTPFLVNGTGNAGDVYLCNVAGTVDFGAGPITFVVSDQVIYSGSIWQKASGSNGTVTSVAITESGDSLNITGSPITTSGTINIGFNGTNLQYINGAGDLTTFPTLLSSVGLSMPSAFNVSNSPLTANGTIGVTGAGNASQYIRGDGTLAAYNPSTGGGGSSVSYYLNGGTNQGTFVGNTYYEMSKTAVIGTGVDFTINANGYISQFITDANDPAQLVIPAGNWNFEMYFSASSSGGSPSFYVELYKYNGSTFTLIADNSANPEYITNGTAIDLYTTAVAVPETSLTITDRLAIRVYVIHASKTITLHTQDSHLCQVITTFSTGITALNGLTAQVQYFATGTSGTDFAINSSTATHTFNLPTASATNRGALSSADWTTFNNKLSTATAAATYVPYTGATNSVDITGNNFSSSNIKVNGDNTTNFGYLGFKQYAGGSSGLNGYTSIFAQGTNSINFAFSATGGSKTISFLSDLISTSTTRSYSLPNADGTLALVGGAGVGTVTSVAALTLGTTGTDLSSTVANSTTTPVITLNVPTASATNRGALSSADWTTFNNKQAALTNPVTGTGTINTHSKFTSASVIGNSMVSDDGTTLTSTGATRSNLYIKAVNNTYYGQLAFTNGTNASSGGISYNNASQYMQFETSTSEWMRLTSDGKLGIGTTSPAYTLDVSGTIRGTGTAFDYYTSSGLGTSSASGLMRVITTGTSVGIAIGQSNNTRYTGISANEFKVYNDDFSFGTASAYPMYFQTNGTNRLTITSAGNVGIGTSSPASALHAIGVIRSSNAGNTISTRIESDGLYTSGSDMYVDAGTSNIRFYTTSERMRITSGGNVLIGNSNGSVGVLNVTGRIALTTGLFFSSNLTSEDRWEINGGSSTDLTFTRSGVAERMRISSAGVVTITNLGTGTVTATSGVLSAVSDMNLKIEDGYIDTALDKILKLTPRYFYWKEETGLPTDLRQLGFYAQEVNEAIGEEGANTPRNENDKWGIYDRAIIAMLTKAMQEQNQIIEETKARLDNAGL